MSGQATGWVLRHGPCTRWAVAQGLKKDRSGQAVLAAIADAANRDGENAHPGIDAMIDSSGYAKSTVFEALDRLESIGYVEITEQGGGRGRATVYRIPGVSDPSWRPTETVQIPDAPAGGNGPDADEKGSSPAGETVQMGLATPTSATGSNGTTQPSGAIAESVHQLGTAAAMDGAFEVFYAAYPRKVGKGDARKAWPAAVRAAHGNPQVIIDGAVRYAAEVGTWPKGRERFVKHPGPWLRAERWSDEPGANAAAGGRPAPSGPRRPIDSDRSAPSGEVAL